MGAPAVLKVFVYALLLLPGLVAAQGTAPDSTYRIGAKDLLEIRVFEESTLNVDRRVPDSGAINLPLLGEFPVAGMTANEAAAALKTALERSLLQRATVTVVVREFRSRPITVIGAVKSPGNLDFSGRMTLLEALTEAGGLLPGRVEQLYVLRRAANGLSDQITINLDDLLVHADPAVNIPIYANDIINVPAEVEKTVLAIGEVAQPGAVTFGAGERITLLAAIAKLGGLTDRASKKIVIKRQRRDGEVEEIRVKYKDVLAGRVPDPVLESGDLIVVKESFF